MVINNCQLSSKRIPNQTCYLPKVEPLADTDTRWWPGPGVYKPCPPSSRRLFVYVWYEWGVCERGVCESRERLVMWTLWTVLLNNCHSHNGVSRRSDILFWL